MDDAVLVTGASSGIGAELAHVAGSDGFDVVLTARREERLHEIADEVEEEHGVETFVVKKDLSETDAPCELYDEVDDAGIDVHTLVNNAGFGVYGGFDGTDWDTELDMLRVNVVAVTELTKLFVPEMVEHGEGGVLSAGSIASYFPTPRMAVYGATKAYVLWLSRALAHEFEDDGLTVTAYCPLPVETEFMGRNNVEESALEEGITNDAETVARNAWKGYRSGKRIVWTSRAGARFARLSRLLPHRTVTSLSADVMEEGVSYNPF
ncbi:MAG: SDR family oxidoreductase [Halobacteriales archaeon]|nr:SDR family oxidoreductase [Halobacteriales archaeon]